MHFERFCFASTSAALGLWSTALLAQPAPMPPPVSPPMATGDWLPPLGPMPPGLIPPPAPRSAPPPPSFAPPVATTERRPTSKWELGLGVSGRASIVSEPNPMLDASAVFGDMTFTITRFLSPVIDDDAPRGLQPFLQRTSTVSAAFTFGGASANLSRAESGSEVLKQFDLHGGPSVAASIYVVPEFALTVGFSYLYDAETDGQRFGNQGIELTSHEHQVSPSVGVAVRFGDTRIDLGYTFVADTVVDQAVGSVGGGAQLWGTIAANVETVVARKVDIDFGGQVFDAGAGGSASVDFYPSKDFDVSAGGFGYVGRTFYRTAERHNDYGLDVGAGYWVAPRVRLLATYQLSGITVPRAGASTSQLDNQLAATVRLRLP